jgi:hypothetical protein
MLYNGEIDTIEITSSYPCIPLKPNDLDANTWLDIAFVHSVEINHDDHPTFPLIKVFT